jgi:hypothetical protein
MGLFKFIRIFSLKFSTNLTNSLVYTVTASNDDFMPFNGGGIFS